MSNDTKKEEKNEDVKQEQKETKATKAPTVEETLGAVAQSLVGLSERLEQIDDRLNTIETGGRDAFKKEATKEDIERGQSKRRNVDSQTSKIVDEMLGQDFGAEVTELGNRPGYRFTIVVPQRLSEIEPQERPVLDENGKYKTDENGATIMEKYYPEDRRSRILTTMNSYDAIRQHCERVRGNIVVTFQKAEKPLPEFKVS